MTSSQALCVGLTGLQKRAHQRLKKIQSESLPDIARTCSQKYEERERHWKLFCDCLERHIGDPDVTPESVWVGVCRNDRAAISQCQAYLEMYADSKTMMPCPDGETSEQTRRITSANTIDKVWRYLVSYADATVLQKKREEYPEDGWRWTLKYTDVKQGKLCGPVSKVTLWIEQSLAPEFGLALEQQFVKKGATADDVIIVLSTLWQRAKDIPASERLRVAFHSTLLLCSIGGFRMGVVQKLTYRQVQLALVRVQGRLRLVATVTLQQNKRRQDAIKKTQDDIVSFSITFVPCKVLCLLSLLVAQALADDAFDTPTRSLGELLNRPRLESHVNYLPFSWKGDILDDEILPISYCQYWRIWSRTIFVAGTREPIRPYATRVGAGHRLDGALTSAMRGYIMSNTDKVFQKSYQTQHIAKDLMQINFGNSNTGNDAQKEQLFELLERACLKRDENAPIYLSRAEKQALGSQEHVAGFREGYQKARDKHGRDSAAAQRMSSQLRSLQEIVERRALGQKRRTYFDTVDRLRALGKPVEEAFPDGQGQTDPLRRRKQHALAGVTAIAEFMHSKDLGGENREQKFVEILCELLARRYANIDCMVRDMVLEANDEIPPPLEPVLDPKRKYRCLFGCDPVLRRASLTAHLASFHEPSFKTAFGCPECRRLGMKPVIIEDVKAWCTHTEHAHGQRNAPSCIPTPRASSRRYAKPPKVSCLFCQATFCEGQGYSTHFGARHAVREFLDPFLCPECQRLGTGDVFIDGIEAWKAHTREVHDIDALRGSPVSKGSLKRISASRQTKTARRNARSAETGTDFEVIREASHAAATEHMNANEDGGRGAGIFANFGPQTMTNSDVHTSELSGTNWTGGLCRTVVESDNVGQTPDDHLGLFVPDMKAAEDLGPASPDSMAELGCRLFPAPASLPPTSMSASLGETISEDLTAILETYERSDLADKAQEEDRAGLENMAYTEAMDPGHGLMEVDYDGWQFSSETREPLTKTVDSSWVDLVWNRHDSLGELEENLTFDTFESIVWS